MMSVEGLMQCDSSTSFLRQVLRKWQRSDILDTFPTFRPDHFCSVCGRACVVYRDEINNNSTYTNTNTDTVKYYGRALSSISEGVTRLARAGRMICKVRRDFKIITDVLSRVSLVTSNIRESSICSPKSLYKQTSNEILVSSRQLSKQASQRFRGLCPSYPVCYDRRVSNS